MWHKSLSRLRTHYMLQPWMEMKGWEVCYSVEHNTYISGTTVLFSNAKVFLFVLPSLLNREVQHLCDSKSTKCEEHNHCCQGQLAQLGARLHVVSPSSSSDKTSPSAPPSPSLFPLLSIYPALQPELPECFCVFFFHLLLSINLPPSPLFSLLHPKCPLFLYCFTQLFRTSDYLILFFICSPSTPLPLSSSFSTLAPSQPPFLLLLCHFF